ncbi:MAG: helix-turn-helix transcriptional regulator [Nitrospiraceae bacterium]|nr:helix-turn-helix transcriptional regulator [Nitrospiraceae bacterium]
MLDKSLLGEAILRLRGERSQRYVAKKASVPTGTWCQWEKGKRHPRDSQLAKILKGLNCTYDNLTLEIWKIQAERFKLKGSEAIDNAGLYGTITLLKRIDELMQIDLHTVPEASRPALRRLREIIAALCAQIEPLIAEYEALLIALQRVEGLAPLTRSMTFERKPDDDNS